MAEVDYRPDEESERVARELASLTVNDLRRSTEPGPDENQEPSASLEGHARERGIDAPLHDVTFVLEKFAAQLAFVRWFDGPMPCVHIPETEISEVIPFSFESLSWPFLSRRMWLRSLPFPPDIFYDRYVVAAKSLVSSGVATTLETWSSVLERMGKSLGDFLAYRIGGFRAWSAWMLGGRGHYGGGGTSGLLPPGSRGLLPPPVSSSPGGGLGVEFCCQTPGLTIEFSHAYFIHFLNFGAPSFPVRNTMLAGRYVFQGKGPAYPSGTLRSQVFRIPPDYKATTTYF
jgi:hypothetical protein